MWSIDYVQVPADEDVNTETIPISPLNLKNKVLNKLDSKLSSECSLSDSEKTAKTKATSESSRAKKHVEELVKQISLSAEDNGSLFKFLYL